MILLVALCAPASGETARISCYNEGIDLAEQGRYDEAVAAYDRAIEINPQSSEAWCNKGNALNNLSKHDLALLASEKAIEIDPMLAEAWNCKETALRSLGRNAEADLALARAMELGYSG